MRKPKKTVFYMLLVSGIMVVLTLILQPLQVFHFQQYITVLFPKGFVGIEERNLLLIIQGLMLVIIVPVYILTFIFSWRYRARNSRERYDPDLVDHRGLEILWWVIPLAMTAVVSSITWVKTYELDPWKPLVSEKKEMKIQAIALQWKWLFIYPEEKIATVNFVQFPKDQPVFFEITADAPMNAFWIPQLGGMVYAMPGMTSQLRLIANEAGDFRGCSSNISGDGFAGMTFVSRACTDDEYKEWVAKTRESTQMLDLQSYEGLIAPSYNNPVTTYQLKDDKLFNEIVMKFMHPPSHKQL